MLYVPQDIILVTQFKQIKFGKMFLNLCIFTEQIKHKPGNTGPQFLTLNYQEKQSNGTGNMKFVNFAQENSERGGLWE